jgi:hypothetical protein
MSVRLDWEFESEQQHIRQTSGEDPETRRKRRRQRLLILMLPLFLLGLVGLVVGAVALRLREVDRQVEQALRGTIDAEVAALRLGDEQTFLAFQRSATEAWGILQQEAFAQYQTLKQAGSIQLSGEILNVLVDGSRARAQVQEIIDGAPYVRTWFYWRYEDGWRHVPPDYTFWGEAATLEAPGLQVHFQAVDAPVARPLRDALAEWLRETCAVLVCGDLPLLRVDVVPEPGLKTGWSVDDPWRLLVRSPYTQFARADMPFDFTLQFELANLMAERLVAVATNDMQPVYPADAYYLRSSAVSWLVGRFARINTNTFLISSLAAAGGDTAVGRLLRTLPPEGSIRVLNDVLGTNSLADTPLDWRDFLTWRLALENELISRGDEAGYLSLYDTRDEAVRSLAYARYAAGPQAENPLVLQVTPQQDDSGAPLLATLVERGGQQETVLFRLVDERWLRAN